MKFESDVAYHPLNGHPLIGEDGLKYGQMSEGFISFGDVSRNILNRQCQYGSFFIDGIVQGYPKLGEGLRFNGGEDGNYHSLGIHPDDIEEFVRRFHTYDAYRYGYVKDGDGNIHDLCEGDLEVLHSYLEGIGAFSNELA